ncbi:MAG: hypothetical protein ACRC0V_05965, partial [Fusobacteriaceae bacterium]
MMKFTKKGLLELMGKAGAMVQLTKECIDRLEKETLDTIVEIRDQVEAFNKKKVFNEAQGKIEQIEMTVDREKCVITLSNGKYINLNS